METGTLRKRPARPARSARASRRSAELHWLWTRLRETNSGLASLLRVQRRNEQIALFPLGDRLFMDTLAPHELRGLERARSRLEKRRDATRQAINKRSRSLIRPLTIMDLPNELLTMIFEEVRGDAHMHMWEPSARARGHLDVARWDVQGLRLTCRRFCDNSSHLLIPCVTVDLTAQSLDLLEKLSRHPTISKGIRGVKVHLGRYFDGRIAQDFGTFARYQASRLRAQAQEWIEERDERELEDPTWDGDLETEWDMNIAMGLAVTWEDAAQRGVVDNCPDQALLNEAHLQYQRSYEDQLFLQRGFLAQSIAKAMARMPTARTLCLGSYEAWRLPLSEKQVDSIYIEATCLENRERLQWMLQAPVFHWETCEFNPHLGKPPIEMIPSILLAIEEAKICLEKIDVRLPLRNDVALSLLPATRLDHSKLRAASQHMKAFTFEPGYSRALELDEARLLNGFLSTLLDTSALQKIELGLGFQYKVAHWVLPAPTFSMAPILFSRHWPNLQELTFQGPFYFEELLRVIDRVGKGVRLRWSGYLMDRSWAELLDLLKDRDSDNFHLGSAYGWDMDGAECTSMTSEEIEFVRHEPRDKDHEHSSWATWFIRGWTNVNPYRAWAEGELDAYMSAPVANR